MSKISDALDALQRESTHDTQQLDDLLTKQVLEIMASPAGRAVIAAAMKHPLVGKRCLVPVFRCGLGDPLCEVTNVEPSGMLNVRGIEWSMEYVDLRVRPDQVEWIQDSTTQEDK